MEKQKYADERDNVRYACVYKAEELLPIVAKLTRKLTSGESTSIPYEKAAQLMEAVLYCIREWEMSEGDALLAQEKVPAQRAYELGLARVEEKVKQSLDLYNRIMEHFDAYGNHCLYDTMTKELPEFFKWYDFRFAPQDAILDLDYPVAKDMREFVGVDAVWEYLKCIWEEQRFLSRLDRDMVVEILREYCEEYEKMIDNLKKIVEENL